MHESRERLDKALEDPIEKSKRTDERLQAIRDAAQAVSNGLDDGLLMTRGRWCNRLHCPANKMNWCEKDECMYLVPIEPDFAKEWMDFEQVDPHNDAKPSELIQQILKEVEKRL